MSILEKRSRETFKKVKKRLRKLREEEASPKSVHNFRTSVRKFRSFISFVKPYISKDDYGEIQDFFRQRAKDVERLREIDVIIEDFEKIQGLEDSSLLKALTNLRGKEAENVLELFNGDYFESLDQAYKNFEKSLNTDNSANFKDNFKKRLKKWDKFINKRFDKLEDLPIEEVHRVRLRAKKARYIHEIFKEDIGPSYKIKRDKYQKIQDDLGIMCDQSRNVEALDELLTQEDYEKYPSLEEEVGIFKNFQG